MSVIWTTCNTHCGGSCPLKLHVEDGRVTRIETDDGEEPQIRACLRGRAYRQRVYSPGRLQYPLLRTGERGEGKFERISWDRALGMVASELIRTKKTYGNSAILLAAGAGNQGLLHGYGPIHEV